MKFRKHNKYLLLVLLLVLNFIIRIPSVPHEIGSDSYGIHIMANSISSFGFVKYWVNPLSIFGFYPYSYASSVPVMLSGISQIIYFDVEKTIWVLGVITGILSMFTAYLLAGAIWDDDVFKFLVAFIFSSSPGVLLFSTWDATTRGLFMIILPLFMFLILKSRSKGIKYILLLIIVFVLLMATHHYFFLTIPIVFSLVILIIIYKFGNIVYLKNQHINIALILGFIVMFLMPFFTRFMISGSRYSVLQTVLESNIRYMGIIFIFSFVGIAYLCFKSNKSFEEWFILFSMLVLTPFLYNEKYGHYFFIAFFSVFIGFALTNISRSDKIMRKYAMSSLIIILLISIGFSGFYQHWRTHVGGIYGDWYLDEPGYNSALWIKENIDNSKRLVGNDNLASKRIFAISGVPTLLKDEDNVMLAYGFADINHTPIVKNSVFSPAFYMDNPYVIKSDFPLVGWYNNYIMNFDVDSQTAKGIIDTFNLSYIIENNFASNKFFQSLHIKKDNIYNNGKVKLWSLED